MKTSELVETLRLMREQYIEKGCSLDQFDEAMAELINEERDGE